ARNGQRGDEMRDQTHTHLGDADPVGDLVIAADDRSVRPVVRGMLARLHPSWHADAACSGVPTVVFFPERGGKANEARAICSGCRAMAECRDEAHDDDALVYGIRAGLSVAERRDLRAERAAHPGHPFATGNRPPPTD